jgi:hypothetical protein
VRARIWLSQLIWARMRWHAESEHFYDKPSQSQGGDSMTINGHNEVEIRITNTPV